MNTTKLQSISTDGWQELTENEQKDINGGFIMEGLMLSFVVAYYAGYAYGRSQR